MVDNTRSIENYPPLLDKLWKQMDSQYKDTYKDLMETKDRKIKGEI